MLFRGADPDNEEEVALEYAGACLIGAAAASMIDLEIDLPPEPEPEEEANDDDE